MSFCHIDLRCDTDRYYALVPATLPKVATRQEIEDAKKTLAELRQQRDELKVSIDQERKEYDGPIPRSELQQMMLPLEIIGKQITEYSNFIKNATIITETQLSAEDKTTEDVMQTGTVEESEQPDYLYNNEVLCPWPDDEDDVYYTVPSDDDIAPAGSYTEEPVDQPSEPAERVPEKLFFTKDSRSIDAFPGNYTPFYAFLNGEYVGYSRLVLQGWFLTDETGKIISKPSELSRLSRLFYDRDKEQLRMSFKQKYPRAFSQWTDDDINLLCELYSNTDEPLDQIALKLGRTVKSVSMQTEKLISNLKLVRRRPTAEGRIYLETVEPATIPDKDIPEYLDRIEKMEEWIKCLKEYVKQQAVENGVCYEGYTLEASERYSMGSNSKKIMDTIQTQFPDLFNSCVQLKTISAIKKKLGDENFRSAIEPLVTSTIQYNLKKNEE